MPNFFIGKSVMVLLTVKEESKTEMKAIGYHLNNAHLEWIIRYKTTGESKGKHQRGPQWRIKSTLSYKRGCINTVINVYFHILHASIKENLP